MALVVNDRVKETSTTTGTGTLTLAGAVTGFETFSSAIGNTNTTYYAIVNTVNAEFEVGLGTVAAGTLARTTVISSSNSDAAVDFAAGTKNVFCTLPASKAVILDASGDIVAGSNTVVTTTGTQILTNKTLTTPVIAEIDSSADITLDATNDVNIPINVGLTFGDDGEKIEGDGTFLTITSSNKLVLDAETDIHLDANGTGGSGGGDILFQDNGTTFLKSSNNTAVEILSTVSDQDLNIRGNDGGSEITALSFDMSAAGSATFNHDVFLTTADSKIGVGTSSPNRSIEISQSIPGIRMTDTDSPAGYMDQKMAGPVFDFDLDPSDALAGSAISFKVDGVEHLKMRDSRLEIVDGAAATPSICNIGNVNTGLFWSAADTLAFSAGGTAQFTMADGVIAPVTDNDVDLGTSSLEFKDAFFDGTVRMDAIGFGTTSMTLPTADGSANQVLTTDGSGTLSFTTPTVGDITSVVAGTGLTGGGTSGDVTLNVAAGNLIDVQADQVDVDLSELVTSTSDADGDFFAVVDAANAQKKLTKANIAISGFNNDSNFIDGSALNASNLSSGTVPNARLDAQLQDVAGLAVTNGGFIVGDGSNFVLETGATARSSIGLGTGDNVEFEDTQLDSLGVGTAASSTTGEIRATNDITAFYSSDKSLKENIKNIENPLEKVSQINGVTFDWTDDYIKQHGGEDKYFVRKNDVGVIAQEIEKVLPQVVATRENGIKAVKYDRIVALLIESVKELKKEIEELKSGA